MSIDAAIDSGNIEVISETSSDVALTIRPDSSAASFQWFYFHANAPVGIARSYRIFNASLVSYHRAWIGYRVLASYDEKHWFRVPTRYDGSHLIWHLRAEKERVAFAFFVPYPESRRRALIAEAAAAPHVTHRVLGHSLQNRPLDALIFGDEARSAIKRIWIVSRQHAGEPMAEYATEGLIRRLLDRQDATSKALLDQATLYVVPNMNPDGSALGNLRANAAGVDLNRAWNAPGEDAPEVRAALAAIAQTGVDYFIDMHGDETRPFIWIIPSTLKPELDAIHAQFERYLAARHQDLEAPPEEITRGIGPEPGMSINYITKTYGCPAWIIELPFKETVLGDSLLEDGCMQFGRECLDALLEVL